MFAVSGANVLARIRRSRRRIVTLIHERVALARSGDNPTRVARLASGWVVLGDSQLLPGYCVLLSDPVVGSINELSGSERARFLADMVAIGDALLAVTDAYRINYEIQGNGDPALHAHIFARYLSEDAERRRCPVWMYDPALRDAKPFDPAEHAELGAALAAWLGERGLVTLASP
jgi:diadenosine tetraphosphate (Ap4A) HIT family hydrolase